MSTKQLCFGPLTPVMSFASMASALMSSAAYSPGTRSNGGSLQQQAVQLAIRWEQELEFSLSSNKRSVVIDTAAVCCTLGNTKASTLLHPAAYSMLQLLYRRVVSILMLMQPKRADVGTYPSPSCCSPDAPSSVAPPSSPSPFPSEFWPKNLQGLESKQDTKQAGTA